MLKKLLIGSLALVGAMALSSAALASTPAGDLQPAENDQTYQVSSLRVGTAGAGGTSFLNGSIINEVGAVTVADDLRIDGAIYRSEVGGDTPLKIADDVRIDGSIYRTEVGGSDPIKVADSIIPTANKTYDLGTGDYSFKNIYVRDIHANSISVDNIIGDGVIATDNINDQAVTASKIADQAVGADQIASQAVTAAKVDFTTDGFVKAAAFVQQAVGEGPGDNITKSYFNSIGSDVVAIQTGPAYNIDFGFDVSNRYVSVTSFMDDRFGTAAPANWEGSQPQNANIVRVQFTKHDGTGVGPTPFNIMVY